jgi:predicted nucleic acid-binding protein
VKLLLDINVLLDVLADREPFAEDAALVLSLVEEGKAEAVIAAHTVTTLFYFLDRDLGSRSARRALIDLLRLVSVVPVDHDRILQALALGWKDFEDAVQAACAAKADAEFIVTRDKKGFARSDVQAITPAELLIVLRSIEER